jgi:hypothetical protein
MYVRYSPSSGAFGINGPVSTQRHRYWYTDNGRLDYVVGMFEKVSDLCNALHMKLGSLSTSVDAVEVFVCGRGGEYVAAAKKRLCKEAIPSAASLPPRVPGASPLRITYLPPEALSPQGSRRHPLTSRMVGDAGLAADTSICACDAGGATESLSDTVAAAFRGSTMAAGRAAKNNFYGRQHKVPLDYAAPRIARILESVGDALERHHPKTIAVGDTPQWVVVDIPLPLDDGESKRPRGITIPAVSKSGADSVEAVKAHLHRHLAPAAAVADLDILLRPPAFRVDAADELDRPMAFTGVCGGDTQPAEHLGALRAGAAAKCGTQGSRWCWTSRRGCRRHRKNMALPDRRGEEAQESHREARARATAIQGRGPEVTSEQR